MTPFIEVWGLRAVGFVSLAGVFLDVKAPITRDFTMRVANFLLESRDRICTRKSASFDIILYFLYLTGERSHRTIFAVSDLKKPKLSQLA
jgi:hypothetical protein